MENNYFVFSESELAIKRFHVCFWEFRNETSLIEFGCEIEYSCLPTMDELVIGIYIPWIQKELFIKDLYGSLKESFNSKFIFNDSVKRTDSLDNGANKAGVIHHFSDREPLGIFPVKLEVLNEDKILKAEIDLRSLHTESAIKPNIYFRFYVEPNISKVSTRKHGIGRSTIIYDTKVNELRNLPETLKYKPLCNIETCFCFNIIPNSYDFGFYDSSSLKNIRTLEYGAFKKYLPDKRVTDQDLLVVFNKKKHPESLNFFSTFFRERIGTGQFALAVLINLVCGILLAFPNYRRDADTNKTSLFDSFPIEFWLAVIIGICTILYFIWPFLTSMRFKKTSQ